MSSVTVVCVLLVFSLSVCFSADTQPLVTVNHGGQLQGLSTKFQNVPIDLFLGVRYAMPPLGDLRFEKPEPFSWEGIADATHVGNLCPQRDPFGNPLELAKLAGEEDCLFLDITVPNGVENSKKKPVMVWIHGGGYTTGTGIAYMGAPLAVAGDVIVVSINYRIGVLGFLFDGPGTGNYGLWDQRAALVWVKENIEQFGGDPEMVTIFGESAGGGSVAAQTMSPHNDGLFKRAIQQSGSLFQPWGWALGSKADGLELLRSHHCESVDVLSIYDCLREVSVEDIFESTSELGLLDHPFLPSADADFFDEGISVSSYKLSQRFELMSGMNGQEGLLMYVFDLMAYAMATNSSVDDQFMDRYLLNVCDKQLTPDSPNLCKDFITNVYGLNTAADDKERAFRIMEFLGEHNFNNDIVFGLEEHSDSSNPTYAYYLTQVPTNDPIWPLPKGLTKYKADHADDLPYVFGAPFLKDEKEPSWLEYAASVSEAEPALIKFFNSSQEKDKPLSQIMMNMWTNFAKSGNPNKPVKLPAGTPTWPQFNKKSNQFLEIKSDNIQVITTPNKDRLDRVRQHLYADRTLQHRSYQYGEGYEDEVDLQAESGHDEL